MVRRKRLIRQPRKKWELDFKKVENILKELEEHRKRQKKNQKKNKVNQPTYILKNMKEQEKEKSQAHQSKSEWKKKL